MKRLRLHWTTFTGDELAAKVWVNKYAFEGCIREYL